MSSELHRVFGRAKQLNEEDQLALSRVIEDWIQSRADAKVNDIDPDAGISFGEAFWHELRELGGLSTLTSRLNYSGIQKLKSGTREDVYQQIRMLGSAIAKRARTDSPRELAQLVTRGSHIRPFGMYPWGYNPALSVWL